MLNTFENSERQYLRRKERERHLHAIDAIANNSIFLTLEETNLAPAADALAGMPLARQPTMRTPAVAYDSRRRRVKRFTGAFLCIALVVIVGVLLVSSFEKETVPSAATGTIDPKIKRYRRLFSLILDWGVTPRSALEDGRSAAAQALEWLAFEDTNTENIETIRSRFSLATLYFSTQSNSSSWKVKNHWLSTYPVCLWHGVKCFDEDDTVELVKAVNLTSNGLTGPIPDEIALLQLDCRSLDLSYNRIVGAIPYGVGASLKNLQHLYLGPNDITSTIPDSIFELSHLTHLYLNDCQLVGRLPPEVGKLSKLQGLGLHNK